jgi:hypothetical protein
MTGYEIAALIEHLVIGEFTFGVTGHQLTFTENGSHVETLLHRYRAGAFIVAAGMPDHHKHVF